MPIHADFLEYHKSIARELDATKDRVRHLIGGRHWQTDGEHKEAVLRKVLRNHLPESVRIGRGFVCFQNEASTQIDVLITASDKPTLFKDGDLVLVTPDAVQAIVEVKTSIRSRPELQDALRKLSDNVALIRSNQHIGCLAGLFVFDERDDRSVCDRAVLDELQSVVNEQQYRVINWIAFGPNRFFRYWYHASDVSSICQSSVWHSYELPEGLAHAYFLSNVAWDITREQRGVIDHEMQYAWFPVEGGKERFRRWCVSFNKADGPPKQFS